MHNKNKIERSCTHPKQGVDAEAEREGAALKKQGQHYKSKYQYIRQQTDNYNKQQLDKLFRR